MWCSWFQPLVYKALAPISTRRRDMEHEGLLQLWRSTTFIQSCTTWRDPQERLQNQRIFWNVNECNWKNMKFGYWEVMKRRFSLSRYTIRLWSPLLYPDQQKGSTGGVQLTVSEDGREIHTKKMIDGWILISWIFYQGKANLCVCVCAWVTPSGTSNSVSSFNTTRPLFQNVIWICSGKTGQRLSSELH